jgi:hypothetical protein
MSSKYPAHQFANPTKPYDLRNADFVNMDHSGMMIKGRNTLGLGLGEGFPLRLLSAEGAVIKLKVSR